jgi:hypothetical protein
MMPRHKAAVAVPQPRNLSRSDTWQAGDEELTWSRSELRRMDSLYRAALQRETAKKGKTGFRTATRLRGPARSE